MPDTPAGARSAAAPTVPAQRSRRRSADPVAPLGSLTQREHQGATACPACGSASLTQLSMTLTDGTHVRFSSCRTCLHRRWDAEGDEIGIDAVLQRSRKG